jgi:2-amino-4-hydroxy-6-hydroxymethyldihydropteridine diphosphokinase
VRSGLDALAGLPDTTLLAASSLYRTDPIGGPPDQPRFCNAAAALVTRAVPRRLLAALHAIEAAHGRVRDTRWGPRTLDLDLLAYDDQRCTAPDLWLPHPRAHKRGFVLVPLAEIAPALELGQHGRVIDCLQRVNRAAIEAWDSSA